MNSNIWAIVPPIVAIAISLITKEVNLSLFVGILFGAFLFTGGNIFSSVTTIYEIMGSKVKGNIGVLIFIIILGMIVHLMNLSGATNRYAQWASKSIKTKKQSLLATMVLGIFIFVDDYFNCLTVGTVMQPITDRNKVSREKLAYIIDSTAAPICIIAPISSWAAAVSSSLPDGSKIDGFNLFMKTIFCNYYSWFSLAFILITTLMAVDFGKMRTFEISAITDEKEEFQDVNVFTTGNGKVIDLILPVAGIIFFSIISMLYTGGFYDGNISIGDAFANCDAITGLAMGALYTIFLVALLYLPRKIVSSKQFLNGLIEGFKNMVPAKLILILAWTLSGICGGDYLNAGGFVANIVDMYNISLMFMPAIFFVFALLLSFSTGTSWGTFAILLPITVSVFSDNMTSLMIMTTAAVLGGSVCGDHLSPISDTTILSSTGAGCNHINHVESQMQYGMIVAGVAFTSYIMSGIIGTQWIGFIFGILALVVVGLFAKKYYSIRS